MAYCYIRSEVGGDVGRRSAVKMAAIFKCYCLRSISLSPAFLPLSLSVTRLREEEGERGGTPRFSEGKNNARYSWGNHLASNLFSLSLSLSLSLSAPRTSHAHECMRQWYMAYRGWDQYESKAWMSFPLSLTKLLLLLGQIQLIQIFISLETIHFGKYRHKNLFWFYLWNDWHCFYLITMTKTSKQ